MKGGSDVFSRCDWRISEMRDTLPSAKQVGYKGAWNLAVVYIGTFGQIELYIGVRISSHPE